MGASKLSLYSSIKVFSNYIRSFQEKVMRSLGGSDSADNMLDGTIALAP